MTDMSEGKGEKRQIPAWLLGLILAVVIFAVVIIVFQALGFGDDPAIQSGARPLLSL